MSVDSSNYRAVRNEIIMHTANIHRNLPKIKQLKSSQRQLLLEVFEDKLQDEAKQHEVKALYQRLKELDENPDYPKTRASNFFTRISRFWKNRFQNRLSSQNLVRQILEINPNFDIPKLNKPSKKEDWELKLEATLNHAKTSRGNRVRMNPHSEESKPIIHDIPSIVVTPPPGDNTLSIPLRELTEQYGFQPDPAYHNALMQKTFRGVRIKADEEIRKTLGEQEIRNIANVAYKACFWECHGSPFYEKERIDKVSKQVQAWKDKGIEIETILSG